MLRTAFCDLVGIEVPIVQAPVSPTPLLAAAVSNAGGLGVLQVSWLELDEARRSIRETRRLTDRPFAVNLVLEWPQWERLEIALEEDVPVVHFHWGDQGEDPKPYLARLREAGVTVLYTTGSAAEARRAVDSGADVVVAQGWEAGGHVCGDVATLPLVPRVVDAVAPVPVLAAGGIGDGRGLVAALALGADGVWVGTRFLASEEAGLHDYYKERVVGAAETDTVHSTLFDIGWADAPHRTLRTSTVRAWEDAGRPAPGGRPGRGRACRRLGERSRSRPLRQRGAGAGNDP